MSGSAGLLDRRRVVATLLADAGELLVVSGLGGTSWDVTAAGDRDRTFPLWGGMGGAVMTGLGLALARPTDRVLVITGDGEALMGLGALATVARCQPANLTVAVIDNERYGETGMQSTHTSPGVGGARTDLAAVAVACGWLGGWTVHEPAEVELATKRLRSGIGPLLAVFKVTQASPPMVTPPRDGAHLKDRFRRSVVGQA